MGNFKRFFIILVSIAVYSSQGAAGAGFDEAEAIVFATPAKKQFSYSMYSKAFPTTSGLIKRIRTHTGEKPYACTECCKAFSCKSGLDLHMRTHTGEKPYCCSECDKYFSQKGNLTTHMRTHTGERPYFCSKCSKTFSHKSHLSSHMRTHTGERPYACTKCSESFTRKDNLNRHKLEQKHTQEEKEEFQDPAALDERLKSMAVITADVLDLDPKLLEKIWGPAAAAENSAASEDLK